LNHAIVRDGRPYSPARPHEVELTSGAREALATLKKAGFCLICVTNQPEVARGVQDRQTVEAMNADLAATLALDDVLVCYHDDADRCACRKPEPGLLLEAAARHRINLRRSFMVGDRWRDIEAGWRAGCRTVLIDYGYTEQEPAVPPDRRVRSLPEAASWIIGQAQEEGTFDAAVW